MRFTKALTGALTLAGASTAALTGAARPATPGRETPRIERLFDLELQYEPGMAPVASAKDREGKLLGSGTGRVEGPSLRGRVEWTLFEITAARACKMNLAGFIQTDDGSRIPFETTGYGFVPDSRQPSRWNANAALRFEAASAGKYAWLSSLAAVWEGTIDLDSGRHTYRAYAAAAK